MPIPEQLDSTFRSLKNLTDELHRMIESGEFYSLSFGARRRKLRAVRRLYNRLLGPVSPRVLVGALAAGVLILAGCFQPVGGPEDDEDPPPDPPAQKFVPDFSTVYTVNPFGDLPIYYFAQSSLQMADLDADGDLDAVYPFGYYIYNYYNGVRWNNAGTFDTTPSDLGIDRAGYGSYVDLKAVADLDGDGDLDAVLSGDYDYGTYTGVMMFPNTGDEYTPGFGTPSGVPFAAVYGSDARDVAFSDFDNDGDLDMLMISQDGSAMQFSENSGTAGAPVFDAPVTFPYKDLVLPDHELHGVDIADIDNDGDPDVLIGTYFDDTITQEPRVLLFENTGAIGAPVFADAVQNPFGMTLPTGNNWTNSELRTGYVGIAAADVDADGDLDIIVGPYLEYIPISPYYCVSSVFFLQNTGTMQDVE